MNTRVQVLLKSGWQGVYYFAGGGSEFLAELLTTPGASQACLYAAIPYARTALIKLLGSHPEQSCSSATARALAMAGFMECRQLGATKAFALGCTASLKTSKPKRGEHRVYVAVQTENQTQVYKLNFVKNTHSRAEEETQVVEFCWACLAHALKLQLGNTSPEPIDHHCASATEALQELITGQISKYCATENSGAVLLPGAFNPLHPGHRKMQQIASHKLGVEVAFELSVTNVDKPPLDYLTIEERLDQFDTPIWMTSLPRFREKARHFPGVTFVVGIDTLLRIDQPRYYIDEHDRNLALAELSDSGAQFLVFGREIDGQFTNLAAVKLSPQLEVLCQEVAEADFRVDMSSSEIRASR